VTCIKGQVRIYTVSGQLFQCLNQARLHSKQDGLWTIWSGSFVPGRDGLVSFCSGDGSVGVYGSDKFELMEQLQVSLEGEPEDIGVVCLSWNPFCTSKDIPFALLCSLDQTIRTMQMLL
jgi:hypothetical protein